jgi:hypothetical protein
MNCDELPRITVICLLLGIAPLACSKHSSAQVNASGGSSGIAGAQPINSAKFSAPTVANGKVYLSSFSNQLCVYGLK